MHMQRLQTPGTSQTIEWCAPAQCSLRPAVTPATPPPAPESMPLPGPLAPPSDWNPWSPARPVSRASRRAIASAPSVRWDLTSSSGACHCVSDHMGMSIGRVWVMMPKGEEGALAMFEQGLGRCELDPKRIYAVYHRQSNPAHGKPTGCETQATDDSWTTTCCYHMHKMADPPVIRNVGSGTHRVYQCTSCLLSSPNSCWPTGSGEPGDPSLW